MASFNCCSPSQGQEHVQEFYPICDKEEGHDGGGGGGAMASSEEANSALAPQPEEGQELGWVNFMGQVMWPYARKAISKKAVAEILERMHGELEKRDEIKVSELSVEYDPGSEPPVIKSMIAYEKKAEEFNGLQIDMEIEWFAANFQCKPTFKGVGPAGMPIDTMNVCVTGVELTGKVSIVMAPLINEEPCFAAQQLFFLDPPDLKLTMSGLKALGPVGSLMTTVIKRTTVNMIADMVVLPHRMMVKARKDVPLESLVTVKSPLPLGILQVEVLEGAELLAKDQHFTGKDSSDPFVEITVGNNKMRTSTISESLSPKWQDGPDYMLVYSMEQKVRIEVFDDDILTDDDLIGWVSGYNVFKLCREAESSEDGVWLPICHPSKQDQTAGKLKLRARFLKVAQLGEFLDTAAVPGSAASARPEESTTPYLVTVKLLGMEGESSKILHNARAECNFTPGPSAAEEAARLAAEPDDGGLLAQGSRACWSGMQLINKTTDKVKKATGLGFGQREPGIPTSKRSSKGKGWAEVVSKGVNHAALSPVVVRAIEQLRHREDWELARIAAMFGIDERAVERAAAVRANFEVAWHQALHFLQPPSSSPFSGTMEIRIKSPPILFGKGKKGAMLKTQQVHAHDATSKTIGEGGLVGSIKLDLSHKTIAGDKPWCRRVRARVRRRGVSHDEEVEEATHEVLAGEGQCDPTIGDVVPGVLVEFLVEVRALQPSDAVNHLEEGQNEAMMFANRQELHSRVAGTRGVQVVSE